MFRRQCLILLIHNTSRVCISELLLKIKQIFFRLGNANGTKVMLRASVVCGQPSEKDVTCNFKLTNNGNEAIFVSPLFTPLHGLYSDCLKVTHNGKDVHYDGNRAKIRYPPPENAFIKLGQKKSISSNFQLSDGYSTIHPGVYKVFVDISLLYHRQNSLMYESKKLRSPPTTFKILRKSTYRKTAGQRQRTKKPISAEAITVGQPLSPHFQGSHASNNLKKQISAVHRAVYFYAQASALETMEDDQHYTLLFGNTLPKRNTVRKHYSDTVKRMEQYVMKYDIYNGNKCCNKKTVLACTSFQSGVIYLCKYMFDILSPLNPDNGFDSYMNTILHEYMHVVWDAEDVRGGYGWNNAKALARKHPNLALLNADNYAYFTQTTYPFNFGIDAMYIAPNGRTYLIKENFYARLGSGRIDPFTLDSGYPLLINLGGWGALKNNFSKRFDSLFNCADRSKTYATSGPNYIRYSDSWAEEIDSGYPRPIKGYWGNLDPDFLKGFDSGCNIKSYGKTYVTKGKYYVRYSDDYCIKVDQGYPKRISDNWQNLPPTFNDGFDSMLGAGTRVFITKGTQYVRFTGKTFSVDAGYPKNIRGQFGGVDYQ